MGVRIKRESIPVLQRFTRRNGHCETTTDVTEQGASIFRSMVFFGFEKLEKK